MALPADVTRVARSTRERDNNRIKAAMARRLRYYADNPEAIEQRLRELDQEWDIERTLEVSASTLSLTGLILAVTRHRGFLLMPFVVISFLLQHALQGWCPPVPLFRRRGVRSRYEIEVERYALKILRGDFDNVRSEAGVEQALRAVDLEAPSRSERPAGVH